MSREKEAESGYSFRKKNRTNRRDLFSGRLSAGGVGSER